MTNTIKLPIINSNILALTSFNLICMMMFIAIQLAFAWHCEGTRATLNTANNAVDLAEGLHQLAKIALEMAEESGNESYIKLAKKAVNWTANAYVNAVNNHAIAREAHLDCLDTPHPLIFIVSEGCVSGGCNS
ncbi:hypothetical protein C6497_03530 [Candidatus Poribacteria bacterium]|nr:MAG: hypothetical protein C6497_03530 [Candidatus Poribacteria bacterium]